MVSPEVSKETVSASFVYTEREFIAAYRGARIAQNESYDSFITRMGVIVGGHVMLLAGVAVLVLWLCGAKGANGPIPWGAAAFNVVVATISGLVLYYGIYGYRRRLRSLYRAFPLRDEKVHYQLTPLRFVSQHRLAQGSSDWSLVGTVTEFRDGFFIQTAAPSGEWIPNHAFDETLTAVDIANLLRSRVNRYKVVNRFASLPEKSYARKPRSIP